MLLWQLPQEIIWKVIQRIDSEDAESLVKKLRCFLPDPNAAHAIGMLYSRIYLGYMVITGSTFQPGMYDAWLLPQDLLDLGSDPEFITTTPKQLSILFTRDLRDYTRFQGLLECFRKALDCGWVVEYLSKIPEITFVLNGRSITTENPTLMLALVLNTLIKLTAISHTNIKSINVSSTDIGDLMPHKWGQIFKSFENTTELILQDNMIRLEYAPDYDALLEQHFRWPPYLQLLSLARNLIENFTVRTARNLPDTLITLDLSCNMLESIGSPHHESFKIVDVLPNLSRLSLLDNEHLVLIDPDLFDGALNMNLLVSIIGCNILDQPLDTLHESAKINKVNLKTDRVGMPPERRVR